MSGSQQIAEKNIRGLPPSLPLVLVALATTTGVCLDRIVDPNWLWLVIPGLLAPIAWGGLYYRKHHRTASIVLLLGFVALGGWWHHAKWNWYPTNHIHRFANERPVAVNVRGRLCSYPRTIISEDEYLNPLPARQGTRFVLELEHIRDADSWVAISGACDLIVHGQIPSTIQDSLVAGARIKAIGRLIKFRPPPNPGQFNFQTFFRTQSRTVVLHVHRPEAVKILSRREGWWCQLVAEDIRRQFRRVIQHHIDPERAGLAAAILLGERDSLERSRRDQFMRTGTVHLLAISGLHVGIMAGLLFWFFRIGFASRRAALIATIIFVFSYAWLVGFRPPVTRAAILLGLVCFGRLIGKPGIGFNLLAFAGLIVIAMNPGQIFQLGTQLSFLAVGTIIAFKDWIFLAPSTRPLDRLIRNTRPAFIRYLRQRSRRVRQAFLVSGMIWILSFPLVAYHYHLFSPIGLLINPIVIVPMTVALFAGLGVLVFGFIWQPLAHWAGWICDRSLASTEWLVREAETIPGGYFWTAGPGESAVVLFYTAVTLLLFVGRQRVARWLPVVVMGWATFCWLLPATLGRHQPADTNALLVCTFVDVGHGTSVLIQLPNGQSLLYDAGTFGSPEHGQRCINGLLWSYGIEHLDALVLSHADVDHFNAVPDLCERVSIGVVYVSPVMLNSQSSAVKHLFTVLKARQIRIRTLAAGHRLNCGHNVRVSVLSPPFQGTGGGDNSDSIVLAIEYGANRVLLPGDLERSGLHVLLETKPLDCDIAMAPHHGSRNSHPVRFVNWCQPEHVVISSGIGRIPDGVIESISIADRWIGVTGQRGAIRFQIPSSGDIQTQLWNGSRWKNLGE